MAAVSIDWASPEQDGFVLLKEHLRKNGVKKPTHYIIEPHKVKNVVLPRLHMTRIVGWVKQFDLSVLGTNTCGRTELRYWTQLVDHFSLVREVGPLDLFGKASNNSKIRPTMKR